LQQEGTGAEEVDFAGAQRSPYRVIDSYCNRRPMSTLASMLQKSRQYTSVTDDQLALDPWISWSTLHRGVNDEVHGILHLGQVIDSTDAAFRRSGGCCGSAA